MTSSNIDLENRITNVEKDIDGIRFYNEELANALARLTVEVTNFVISTEEFKDEMKEFKDEMKEFKNEMNEFKDEMRQSKKDLDKKWGDLANKMGTIIEDIISPSVPTAIKKAFKQRIVNSADHIKRYDKKLDLGMEIDVLANSEDTIYIIESKTTASKDKVDALESKFRSGKFETLFPEYNEFRVVLILASIKIPDSVIEYLHSKNMYPMVYFGDMMEIILPENI